MDQPGGSAGPGRGPGSDGGQGEYDEATGLWEWYEEQGPSWADVLGQWAAIEADFASHYGVDLSDELDRRTWRWFRVRLAGLMTALTIAPSGRWVPVTRLGLALNPPTD